MTGTLPDQVVPNSVPRNPPTVTISGELSGTDPLARLLNLTQQTVSPPWANATVAPNTVLRFTAGDHGSILQPSATSPFIVTCNMQRMIGGFFVSNGAGSQVGFTACNPSDDD